MLGREGRVIVWDLMKCQQLMSEKADCCEDVKSGRKSEIWELQELTIEEKNWIKELVSYVSASNKVCVSACLHWVKVLLSIVL